MAKVAFVLVLCSAFANGLGDKLEQYGEEVLLQKLDDGSTMITYSFESQRSEKAPKNHYKTFPKQIGQIVERFGVERMELSLAKGWDVVFNWIGTAIILTEEIAFPVVFVRRPLVAGLGGRYVQLELPPGRSVSGLA